MGSDPTAREGLPEPVRFRFGDIEVDAAAHTLLRGGEAQSLEPKAFAVLLELLRHAGELVGRDQLLDAVWGHRHVTPGVLTRAVAQLRTALDDDPHHPRWIRTQHALGYRFVGALLPEAGGGSPAPMPSVSPLPPGLPAPPAPDAGTAAPLASAAVPAPAPPGSPALPAPSHVAGPPRPARSGDRRRDDRAPKRRLLVLAALLIVAAGWFGWQRMATPPRTGPSIAVLPFTTLSDDRQDRYFAEGLAAEMLSALAGVHGLRVAAWIPPEALDRRRDLRALGRTLGVASVLDASVRRDGDRLRISAHLFDTSTGTTLWSRTYDRDAAAVFDTQSEIANEVASLLVGVLPDAGQGLRERLAPTRDVAAFDAYLRGLQQLFAPGGSDQQARTHFEQALARDAGFAQAQAGICRIELWRFEGHRNAEAFESARLACLRAANMDPGIGAVQLALGDLYRVREQYDQALDYYRRAEADPSVRGRALAGQARVHAAQGRQDEALAGFRDAMAAAPDDAGLHADLAYQQYLAGALPEAIASMLRASELRPGDAHVWSTYGSMLMAAGRNEEAIVAFERSRAIEPIEAVIANLGTLRYQAGDFAGAAERYREAAALNPGNPQIWGNLGDALRADPAAAEQAREAFGEATSRMQDYLDLNGGDAKALALQAWYRANLGEHELARGLVERSEAIGGEVAEVALSNAQTLAFLGDHEAARQRLATARGAGMAEVRIITNPVLRGAGLATPDPGKPPAGKGAPRAETAHPQGE